MSNKPPVGTMFGITKSLGLWLFSLSSPAEDINKKYTFQDPSLQCALQFYMEGQQFVQEGNYHEACDAFMTGIFAGRKAVEKLQESSSSDEESINALEWIVSSYIECAEARMKQGDWQTARGDAWAACMYSQNMDLRALVSMLLVCENTNDLFGQLSTLKSIQPLLTSDNDMTYSTLEVTPSLTCDSVSERIREVEEMLEDKFKKL